MQTTVELPEPIYRLTEEAAQARGVSVVALISDVLGRELAERTQPVPVRRRVTFPVMSSREPESMELSDFNFDDLLA